MEKLTLEKLEEMEARGAMAAEVTLPGPQFLELVRLAKLGLLFDGDWEQSGLPGDY